MPPSPPVHMLPPSLVRVHCSPYPHRLNKLFLVAASEVSSILESRIAGTSVGGNVEETDRVLSAYTSNAACFMTCLR